MHRSKMSQAERVARSRLNQLVNSKEFVRGTLTLRKQTCGKTGCKCAKGKKHSAFYITYGIKGKTKQLYIPSNNILEVKAWIKEYKEIKNLLEKISAVYLDKIKNREV